MATDTVLLTVPQRNELRNFAAGAKLAAPVTSQRMSEIWKAAQDSEGPFSGDDALVIVVPSASHVDFLNRGPDVVAQLLAQVNEYERAAAAHVTHTSDYSEVVADRDSLRTQLQQATREKQAAEASLATAIAARSNVDVASDA